MANSLLSITPHVVSKDLRGYSVMVYGEPKTGKTTIASKFPKSLLLAFEKGYSAIPGVMAKDINTWGEFKKVLSELKDPQVKETFYNIVIDTADIAYALCEKYICNMESNEKNTYDAIGDIPFGKGYKLAMTEFDECIRKILQMGYGLILISHAQNKSYTDENGVEYNKITPTLDARGRLVCERTCDIIGYSRGIETGEGVQTKLFLRGTPRFVAGSRFRHTPEVIDFNYDSLVKAIGDAIDKEALEYSNQYVTEERVAIHTEEKTYDFESLKNQFKTIVNTLMEANQSNGIKITEVVEKYLGKNRKVNECTEAHAEQLNSIVEELSGLM